MNQFGQQPQYYQPNQMMMYNQPTQPQFYPNNQVQPQQLRGLAGRMINDINEVVPQEVPPPGQIGVYPTNDFKRIYTKSWSPDGTQIITNCYEVAKQVNNDETLINILERLESLEKKVGVKHDQ